LACSRRISIGTAIPDVVLAGDLLPNPFELANTALLLGKGDGMFNPDYQTYSTPLFGAIMVDVNGDGFPDIVGGNGLTVARLLDSGSRQASQ